MSFYRKPVLCALGFTVALATVAGAQVDECEVDEGRPSQIARALLAVQLASNAQRPEDAAKQLTAATRLLTDRADRMANQVGRNLVLGKALVLWTIQPNAPLTTTRGAIGYAGDPNEPIDLVTSIDSALKVVETAHPECIAETARWRGQKAWVDLVNAAIERMNEEDVDSAEALGQRALTLNPYAPYGFVVLANVMQKRNNLAESFALYRRAIEVAARDTSFDDIRRQSLVYIGNLAADSAEALKDNPEARRPFVETARQAFEELLADPNVGDFRVNAQAGLCQVAIATGDTAYLRSAYKEHLESPSKFGYSELMNAGVCMARAEMVPDATKLFQSAYEINPYHRDALSNLAIMHLQADAHAKAIPLAQRLVSVEPNNDENLQLLVLSYAGIAKEARDKRLAGTRTGVTGAARLSAAAAESLFKIEQAYTDSAVTANQRKESLATKVQLSEFSTTTEKSSVSGTVTNRGDAEKPFTIRVEFLDRSGRVVASQESMVDPVAAGRSARFSVTTTPGTGISAFRYSIR